MSLTAHNDLDAASQAWNRLKRRTWLLYGGSFCFVVALGYAAPFELKLWLFFSLAPFALLVPGIARLLAAGFVVGPSAGWAVRFDETGFSLELPEGSLASIHWSDVKTAVVCGTTPSWDGIEGLEPCATVTLSSGHRLGVPSFATGYDAFLPELERRTKALFSLAAPTPWLRGEWD
jgi:hypothetical protein